MPDPSLALAADKIREWREKPSLFVREQFGATPDAWQDRVLDAFPKTPQISLQACKGPGKSTLLSWLAWNFLTTRPHPKIPTTSISADNLSDNLWAEMAKWQNRSPLLKARFTWTKTRIYANDHPETWFMAARAFSRSAEPDKQADTLAGYHADYIMFILDEAGGISLPVLVTAEAALSSCVEGHIVMAGNPTEHGSALHHAATIARRHWDVHEITGDPDDPNRSPRVSIEWARKQIDTHGRDNPYVLVNVFGKFPPSSLNALIGEIDIRAAMNRMFREHELSNRERVMGVDVADEGADSSVICKRHGSQVTGFEQMRNMNSIAGASWVNQHWHQFDADACFLDATGGWATGWRDQLRVLNRAPIPVGFANQAHDPQNYFNKRAEMYWDAAQWIIQGGALPANTPAEFINAMVQTTYSYKGNRLILEPKDDIKVKLGYSPDHADAFVLTLAETVTPKARGPFSRLGGQPSNHRSDYDPFAQMVAESYR